MSRYVYGGGKWSRLNTGITVLYVYSRVDNSFRTAKTKHFEMLKDAKKKGLITRWHRVGVSNADEIDAILKLARRFTIVVIDLHGWTTEAGHEFRVAATETDSGVSLVHSLIEFPEILIIGACSKLRKGKTGNWGRFRATLAASVADRLALFMHYDEAGFKDSTPACVLMELLERKPSDARAAFDVMYEYLRENPSEGWFPDLIDPAA